MATRFRAKLLRLENEKVALKCDPNGSATSGALAAFNYQVSAVARPAARPAAEHFRPDQCGRRNAFDSLDVVSTPAGAVEDDKER
jgi:hypothetical protein